MKQYFSYTGGHRTRVAAVTLANMAEDAVAASANLRQILIVSVRYCGPAFVSWFIVMGHIDAEARAAVIQYLPTITLTPYIVLPLFATRFADYAGGIRVSFI